MAKRRRTQNKKKISILSLLPTYVIGMLVAYFLFHALFDDKGLFTLMALNSEREQTAQTLEQVIEKRRDLEKRVVSMRTDSLDLDLLEEQARYVLGMVHEDEMVIMLPETKAATSQ